MTFRRLFTLAALARSLMLATNTAQAGYTFVYDTLPAGVTFGGSTVQYDALPTTSGGVMSGLSDINVANITLTSVTVPPATDTVSFNSLSLYNHQRPSTRNGGYGCNHS